MIATSFSRGREILSRLLKTDNASERFGIFQHVHDFDSRPFHLMQHGVHAGGKITVSDERWRRDDQAGRSRKQTLVNAARKFGDRRVTTMGGNHSKSVDHSRTRAEQAEQGREEGECRQNAKKPFQLWYFKLARFLDDLAQFRTRHVMTQNRGM